MTPHPRTLAAAAVVGLLLTGCTSDPTPDSQRHPRPLGIGVRHGKCQPDSVGVTLLDPVRGQAAGRRRGHRRDPGLRADVLRPARRPRALPQRHQRRHRPTPTRYRPAQPPADYVVAGKTVVESTGPVTIASVEPIKVDLKGDPPTVTLLVCVDRTATSGTEDGQELDRSPGGSPVPGGQDHLPARSRVGRLQGPAPQGLRPAPAMLTRRADRQRCGCVFGLALGSSATPAAGRTPG